MILKIRHFLFFSILLSICTELSAQKVKYKDLYVLLNANDFDQSEPFLRRFMAQEPDHPNANLYMARMFKYKYQQQDILKDTDLFVSYCDSSVYFFRQAYSLIDDKEIKRNDEYYQDYSRRDLRTGKFGVKLADIKFDLENSINDIEKVSNDAKTLRENLDNAIMAYTNAETTFNGLATEHNSMTSLLMKGEDKDLDSLKSVSENHEIFVKSFEEYKKTLLAIPGSGYNQELTVKFVEGLSKVESPDFFSDEIEVYDFKPWSDETSRIVVEEIRPLKANMSEYDSQLDELYRQVTVDSMTVENELATLTEKMFFEQLNNYDSEPLPSLVFTLKVEEVTYYSYFNHRLKSGNLDSANIDFQMGAYMDLMEKYQFVEDAYHALAAINVLEKSKLYTDFVNDRYGDVTGVVSYIAAKGEQVNAEKTILNDRIELLTEISHWGLHGNDSIPLMVMDSIDFKTDSSNFTYKTLAMDSLDAGYVAMGVRYSNKTIQNYAAQIGFDRVVDTIYYKPVGFKFNADSVEIVNGRLNPYDREGQEEKGFIYLLQVKSGTYSNFVLINLHLDTGIKWSTPFENPFLPIEMNVDTNTSLIVLKMGEIDKDGQSTETENLVFNFEGNLLLTGGD